MSRTRYVILVSSALASFACADHVTDPVVDPPGDPIAFSSTRGGRWQWPDIYIADRDGSNVRRITYGMQPAWSWNGRRIAFYRSDTPYDGSGIYVADADGSNARFVSVGYNPAWSPDGRLAFGMAGAIALTDTAASGWQGYLVDRAWVLGHADDAGDCDGDSWGPGADYPTWAPDGKHVAFLLGCGGWSGRLFLVDADGSEPVPLSESRSSGAPAWSPDGAMIATWIDSEITTIDVSSGVRQVRYRLTDAARGRRLDWSPDGRQIVFAASVVDKEQRIYVLTLETGQVRQLIDDVWLSKGIMDYYTDSDVAWARVM